VEIRLLTTWATARSYGSISKRIRFQNLETAGFTVGNGKNFLRISLSQFNRFATLYVSWVRKRFFGCLLVCWVWIRNWEQNIRQRWQPVLRYEEYCLVECDFNLVIPYILESNPHSFYSFRGLKNQMRIRIECGLDSRSRAGFWKNYRAGVLAVRTIQLFIIKRCLCNTSWKIWR
jgi:hypothetical protein